MENYPAVNIFCELWPFGTYDPDKCIQSKGPRSYLCTQVPCLAMKNGIASF